MILLLSSLRWYQDKMTVTYKTFEVNCVWFDLRCSHPVSSYSMLFMILCVIHVLFSKEWLRETLYWFFLWFFLGIFYLLTESHEKVFSGDERWQSMMTFPSFWFSLFIFSIIALLVVTLLLSLDRNTWIQVSWMPPNDKSSMRLWQKQERTLNEQGFYRSKKRIDWKARETDEVWDEGMKVFIDRVVFFSRHRLFHMVFC